MAAPDSENGSSADESGSNNGTGAAKSGSVPPENGSKNGSGTTIPADINSWDRLGTAQFYHRELGWAVHALCPPDRGEENERGKKPIAKGWRAHTAAEVTPDYLAKYFANGSNHNIGVVVRAPFVHVDLDSKARRRRFGAGVA